MDSGSSPYSTFFLRIDTQIPGWEKAMIKILNGIPGATFSIDPSGLARVSGNIDPAKTLKLLTKAPKHAELYSIVSATNRSEAEKRNRDRDHDLHHLHGRYWHANHHQGHQPNYPTPSAPPLPLPPPPQYASQPPPMLPAQNYYAGEPQCTIM